MKKPASDEDKSARKRGMLIERTAEVYGLPKQEVESLLRKRHLTGVRVNRLKTQRSPEYYAAELHKAGLTAEPLSWYGDGLAVGGDKSVLSRLPSVTSGELYIQNPSSFVPVLVLDPQPGEMVLDMCAAPGSKASMIASLTGNGADLWVNDNSRARHFKMRANFERLGVQPAETTMFNAEQIGRRMPAGSFDKILLDAPCSGEGLIDIGQPETLRYWSVPHIRRLQQLQKKAILNAWTLLKPGGTLVYSTCTIAPEENEAVADYLLRRQADARTEPIAVPDTIFDVPISGWRGKIFSRDIRNARRIRPTALLEAFFVIKITKTLES